MIVPSDVRSICETLTHAGFEAWVVGGAVRDSLLGREAHDWDIATNARPDSVKRIFKSTISTGEKHGTLTVRLNGQSYEVTTFRGDGDYADGRRPEGVTFLDNIDGDLARRDFTVNAIAYDPLRNVFRDPFLGQEDLKAGLLRAVGNPEQRFTEDGLRCLRACRFAATLGFRLDPATQAGINPSLASYSKVSSERIRDEWLKSMSAAKPSVAFNLMLDTGLLKETVPEFIEMVGCKQNRYHEHDVWGHTLAVVDALAPGDPILRVTGLFHDVAKPRTKCFDTVKQDYTFHEHDIIGAEMTNIIFNRLRFSNDEKMRVCHLIRHHLIHYKPNWQDKAVRRWLTRITPEHLDSLFMLAKADIDGKGDAKTPMDWGAILELRHRIETLEAQVETPKGIKGLAINGKDLMDLGITQGPELGRILKALLEEATDDPVINQRETLIERARSLATP